MPGVPIRQAGEVETLRATDRLGAQESGPAYLKKLTYPPGAGGKKAPASAYPSPVCCISPTGWASLRRSRFLERALPCQRALMLGSCRYKSKSIPSQQQSALLLNHSQQLRRSARSVESTGLQTTWRKEKKRGCIEDGFEMASLIPCIGSCPGIMGGWQAHGSPLQSRGLAA